MSKKKEKKKSSVFFRFMLKVGYLVCLVLLIYLSFNEIVRDKTTRPMDWTPMAGLCALTFCSPFVAKKAKTKEEK